MRPYTKADWTTRAAGLSLRHQTFLDAHFVDAASGATFQSINPATDAVLQPAQQSPLSALRLTELVVQSGVADGVFNVVPGFGQTAAAALGLHMDVDCLVFTGSTAIGKIFMQYSGQSILKQLWPETGGKSPNLVLADCGNLDAAADLACRCLCANTPTVRA